MSDRYRPLARGIGKERTLKDTEFVRNPGAWGIRGNEPIRSKVGKVDFKILLPGLGGAPGLPAIRIVTPCGHRCRCLKRCRSRFLHASLLPAPQLFQPLGRLLN